MAKACPVVHFEMPYEDAARVSAFYEKAFGWKMQQLGAEMGDYVLAETTETGADMRPTTPGEINGGFFKSPEPRMAPSVVIAVEDIRSAMKAVTEAGGEVLGGFGGDVDDIPGVGLYTAIRDTEGSRVGLLQPAMPSQ